MNDRELMLRILRHVASLEPMPGKNGRPLGARMHLATLAGIDRSMVTLIECGARRMGAIVGSRLAQAFPEFADDIAKVLISR